MIISRNTVINLEGEIKNQATIILQLQTLFSTPVGSVALDRDFGLDMTAIDLPMPIAKAMLSAEVITKVAKYVPEIQATAVKFKVKEIEGEMQMEVTIKNV